MNTSTWKKGEVIFHQNEPGTCMYEIRRGRVGIYLHYDTPEQQKLTELEEGQYFGEMGLLDNAPRSASAVSLTGGTTLREITESQLGELFAENPNQVMDLLRQQSKTLRRLTEEYMDVCRTAERAVRAEENALTAEELEELKAKAAYYAQINLTGSYAYF